MADRENGKKQLVLRLSPVLWRELAAWARDDFRSINGQIEYLLTDCVRQRRRKLDREREEGRRSPASGEAGAAAGRTGGETEGMGR